MHLSFQDSESVAASRCRWARGKRARLIVVALMLCWLAPLSYAQMTNGILRETYTGLTGSSLLSLTNNSSFPNSPTSNELAVGLWESPSNVNDNFGERYR